MRWFLFLIIFLGPFMLWETKVILFQSKFDRITKYSSLEEVVKSLGDNYIIRKCGHSVTQKKEDISNVDKDECFKELYYENFINAWSVGINPNGQVISKYHYQSN